MLILLLLGRLSSFFENESSQDFVSNMCRRAFAPDCLLFCDETVTWLPLAETDECCRVKKGVVFVPDNTESSLCMI